MFQQLKRHARLFLNTQLMVALEGGEEILVGGQAVIEGVMMRSPHAYCVSVRKPGGEITCETGTLIRPSERRKIWKYPVLRGLGTLGQAMKLGIRSLRFSANAALEEEQRREALAAVAGADDTVTITLPKKKAEIPAWAMAINLIFSLGFFIVLYKFIPLVLATQLKQRFPVAGNQLAFNFVDGVIRLVLFFGFLIIVSRMKDIHRVFEYHGAEHKVVYNFESRTPVTVENARRFSTLHPRCGTSFLLIVMLLSMLVYMLIPAQTFAMRLLARIVLLPVIAGVSFELIRFAAKRQGSLWAAMVKPGLWLQKITTQAPADGQLLVAIHALDQAMELEKERGGELVIA